MEVEPLSFRRKLQTWLAAPYDLDEEWTERARVEVKEDPATVRDNVRTLRDMVQGEENLYSRTDDLFLLAFLRARKHNIEEAFQVLKNYYQVRDSYPQFFNLCLPSDNKELYDMKWINLLKDKDQNNRAVVFFRADFNTSRLSSHKIVQIMSHTLDLLIMDPHTQISGIATVTNMHGYGMSHLRLITPTSVLLIVRLFQDSCPVRIKSSCLFREPYLFNALWALLRPLLKEKLRKRVHLTGTDVKALHEEVTPNILPTEAGGVVLHNSEVLQEQIGEIEDYFQEWHHYGYNKRPHERRQRCQ